MKASIDIGTTNLKVTVFNKEGQVAYQNQIRLLTEFRGSIHEQDPEEVYQAYKKLVEEIPESIKNQLSDFVFTNQMHSMILLDKDNQLLTKSWLWSDQRANEVMPALEKKYSRAELVSLTGTPLHSMSWLAKLSYLKDYEPDLYARIAKIIDIKSYLIWRISGIWLMDFSTASATGLMNLKNKDWDSVLLKNLTLKDQQFIRLVEPTHLIEGQPNLIVGASDGCMANLGLGAVGPGDYAITIGTSAAIRTVVSQPPLKNDGSIFCYYLSEGAWVIGGAMNNGGNVVDWLANHYQFNDDYNFLPYSLSKSPIGAKKLRILPYLFGERAPYWKTIDGAKVNGLRVDHKPADVVRAHIEGMAYNLLYIKEKLEEAAGQPAERIALSGGIIKSESWCQLLADIFQSDFSMVEDLDASSLGAYYLAKNEIPLMPQKLDINANVELKEFYEPIKEDYFAMIEQVSQQ